MYVEIIPQILNLIVVVGNVYWSFQLKQIQSSKALLDSLRESNREKDEVIQTLQRKKNEYKSQFQHQFAENEKLRGQLHIYQKIYHQNETT